MYGCIFYIDGVLQKFHLYKFYFETKVLKNKTKLPCALIKKHAKDSFKRFMNRLYSFGLITCLILLFTPFRDIFAVYTIQDIEDSVLLGKYFEVYEDNTNSLTLEKILTEKIPWQKNTVDSPNFGYKNSSLWIKFQVQKNHSIESKHLLEIEYPLLDHVDFYFPSQTGYTKLSTGDNHPPSERPTLSNYFAFPIEPAIGVETVYYFRIQSTSPLIFPLKLWKERAFRAKEIHEGVIIWIYYGIFIAIFLYNVFIFIMTRENIHLIYCSAVASYGLFSLALNGYGGLYVWTGIRYFEQEAPLVFLAITLVTHSVFFYSYLFSRSTKGLYYYSIVVLNIFVFLSFFARIVIGYRLSIQMMIVIAILIMVIIIVSSIHQATLKKKLAYFYLGGFGFFILGNLFTALRILGYLPSIAIIYWSPFIGSAIEMLIFSLGIGYRYNLIKLEKERAEISSLKEKVLILNSISRFVPKQFIKILDKEDVSYLNLGDSKQVNMSVLFADIRGFTSLSENMNAEDTFKFINSYLKRMGPVIQKYNGFIDKFIGDAIMALFASPVENAIEAAIEMRHTLGNYNERRKSKGFIPIEIGIGINTGLLMMGAVGSQDRLDSTVIGDAVNLASRVESLTKFYGVRVLITDILLQNIENLENLERYDFREIDSVIVKGKTKPIVLYEIFNAEPEEIRLAKKKILIDFTKGLALYKSGSFLEAKKVFENILKICPWDKPTELYITRCEKYISSPPPSNWTGVMKLN